MRRRREHLRDHVTGAEHDHVLAHADVLARQILLVVQRRLLDRDAGDVDRFEDRVRVQVTEFAGVPADSEQLGDRGRRRELPGDRPAGIAPDDAQPALELELVDLDDDPVDLELERTPPLLPGATLGDDLVLGRQLLDVGVDREAVRAQPLERLPVGVQREPLGNPDRVAPQRQRSVGGELRIELADRAGGRVARVHERRQPRLGPPLVERSEVGQRHVDLTADLDQRRRIVIVEPQRDRADRAEVVGHVLADFPVSAGRAALEHAVAIDQRDRQAVDLGLGDVLELGVVDPLPRQVVAHPLDPRPQLVRGAGVGEREHRLRVPDLDQIADRLTADPLRRGVWRDQLGMRGLDRAQLIEQRVVLGIADLGIVEDVVAVAVMLQQRAQLSGPSGRVLRGRAAARRGLMCR